jgi:phosphoribosylanthranilate isomerase
MIVKICGITNLDDALAAADAGAAALGFNFYPNSPRYITPQNASALIGKLPASIWKVGVFVNETRSAEIARAVGIDIVQLHGDELPSDMPAGGRVWKAFRVTADFEMRKLDEYEVEAFLLDAASPDVFGGSGETFDWSVAAGHGRNLVLAGGLDETNVRRAVETVRPWGVDACSKLESSPGRKDHAKLVKFLKAAL